MDPIHAAIRKPVTVSVGVLLTVLAGLIALGAIPIQLTPDVDTTVISVTTTWEGASPQEIETDVIMPQERKLKGIPGLTKMTSTCAQGEGSVTLEFRLGTPKGTALREVSDRLREVPSYPENVDEPVVRATNPADRDYIAWIVISVTDPNYDVRYLRDFFEDRVKPELERAEGLAEVNVLGGFEREVQVRVDPGALAQRGISHTALVERLRAQNRSVSAGQVEEGKRDIRVRSVGRFESLAQIENTLISPPGVPPVRVRDVAEVKMAVKEPMRLVRSLGRRVLAINAQREVGTNVIAVMDAYKQRLAWVKEHLLPAEARRIGLDGEIVLEQVYDQTVYIHQALDMVRQNLWIGGTLAILVLLVFLRSLRSTLVIALAIPVSVIGTFAVMTALGRNLNVISLAGLAFAVGMVVDNAIVVLENIDRHRGLGKGAWDAAFDGAREVWGAVLASTLTTVAVFGPILFVEEEAGQLFRDIALAVCAAVLLSLVVSITVIPAAASRWLGGAKAGLSPKSSRGGVAGMIGRGVGAMNRSWTVRLTVVGSLTVASLLGSAWLMPPADYLPTGNRNLVFAMLFPPPGYHLDQKEELGKRIEQVVRPFWEAGYGKRDPATLPEIPSFDRVAQKPVMVKVPPIENFFFVAIGDRVFMGAISADPTNVKPVAALLNHASGDLPGLFGFAGQMPLFRVAARGSGSGVELELSGENLAEVNAAAAAMMGKMLQRFGRVTPSPADFVTPNQEQRIVLRPIEAAELGLTQADINTAVQVLGDGLIAGDYIDRGDTIDLKVRAAGAEALGPSGIEQAVIAAPDGRIVPLSVVTDSHRAPAPQQINRIEELPAVSLEASLPPGYPLETATAEIQEDLQALRDAGVIPPTVRAVPAGTAAKLRQVKRALLGTWTGFNTESLYALINSRMFLALVVVFCLMAALFESWVYPLVIMITVPLATVGGFAGLALVHAYVPEQQLDVLTMLGFVILIGVVVNNAILIVHQSLNLVRGAADVADEAGLRRDPLPPQEAIAEAVRTRVRPIFMSTLTSVGGMLPLVLNPGAGSELYRGLGSVVVGGLIVATLFTLLVVPLLLSMVFDLRLAVGGSVVEAAAAVEAPDAPEAQA